MYISKSDVRKHVRSVHKGLNYGCYDCDMCEEKFQHIKRGSNSKHIYIEYMGLAYTCEVCGKESKNKTLVKMHI